MRARTLLHGIAALLGVALACFQAPDDDVIFACDPIADPRCPPGYACEADGCCHREGSDVQASWGACVLGGFETSESGTSGETGTTGTTETSGTDTTSTDTSGTDTSGSGTDTSGTDTSGSGTDTTGG